MAYMYYDLTLELTQWREWQGLRLVCSLESGKMNLSARTPDGGMVAIHRSISPALHEQEAMRKYEVLARGCLMGNGGVVAAPKTAGSSLPYDEEDRWKKLRGEILPTLKDSKHVVKEVYVGYSSLAHGLVFAHEGLVPTVLSSPLTQQWTYVCKGIERTTTS